MVTIGVFNDSGLGHHHDGRRRTRGARADEYGLLLTSLLAAQWNTVARISTEVSMCSVVPPLTGVFEEVASAYFGVSPADRDWRPAHRPADRLRQPARRRERTGSPTPWRPRSLYGYPTIIVDFGTATVFDVISSEGCVPGWGHRPGHQRCRRSSLPEHLAITAHRADSATLGHRPEHHGRPAGRARARLR